MAEAIEPASGRLRARRHKNHAATSSHEKIMAAVSQSADSISLQRAYHLQYHQILPAPKQGVWGRHASSVTASKLTIAGGAKGLLLAAPKG